MTNQIIEIPSFFARYPAMKAGAQAQTQAREANSRVITINEFQEFVPAAKLMQQSFLTFFEIWNLSSRGTAGPVLSGTCISYG
jgi:hypothetical protein